MTALPEALRACVEQEVWKPVVGSEGRYEVSDCGRVRALRFVNRVSDKLHSVPRLLTAFADDSGHLRVPIANGRRRSPKRFVHRLVLEAFGGPCPIGYRCAHLDGNPEHNHISNLRWVTVAENMSHKRLHGTEQTGMRNPFAKLTDDDVRAIRAARHAGERLRTIAVMFGVSEANVSRIERRQSWKHIA